MALRDKLLARTQTLLPEEQVGVVFMGQTGPTPYLLFLSYLTVFWSRYYIVAVTDQSIVTFRSTIWKPSFVKQPVEQVRYARRQMGPLGGLWGQVQLDDVKLHVHKRFHKDVAAADAALAAAAQGFAAQSAGSAQVPEASTTAPVPAMATTSAGWYPDPSAPGQQRWWDGSTWTERTQPV